MAPAPESESSDATIVARVPAGRSFAAGRYAVVRVLPEGGQKTVFVVRDTVLERECVLALSKSEQLEPADLERFRREARAMARLDHPNIVTVHEVGEEDGRPYFVCQYVAGGDLRQALREADGPLPLPRALTIAEELCAALAHAHAAGIVHRDLKPANILLTSDGTVKLGDFGLAIAVDGSRLTLAGTFVGTAAYIAPEQALGQPADARSDLYALGCVLYELLTGRPPFLGDDPLAVISQHVNSAPVAPSWLSDACPQDLEEIVLRLLAKDPGERSTSAEEVLAALGRVDPAEKSASHSDSNVLDRLALSVFVGREHELDRLRKAFDNAVAGHGGLVMLVGEPGIGKTRTTQELETYAKMRGAQVLRGRTHESAGAPPYWPWLAVGNQYATAHLADLPTLIDPQMPPGSVSELSRIFPWLKQGPNFVEPKEIDDPDVAQFRLFDAYTSYLNAIANQAPLVIALDDLHWADKPTLQMLQHIARELSRMRVLIVANYRDTDITRQSALSETLASLNRESGFDRIVLRGLSRNEVAAYIKARANVEPRRDVLDRIFEETEGNAFFLSEVVNLMAQEGTLTKTSISDIAIPDGVREALGRRLNRLTEETNELLQVAAIIGRDFTYDTLTLLGDRDEDALLKMIEEALDARVIEETEQAGRYRFTHAQMQETLLAELSTTRRVRLHGQVGEALERRYGARADERAARLSLHFAEAATLSPRFSEKAVHYATIAGRQALEQSAYPEAARHFRAALSAREGQEMDDDMAGLLYSLAVAAAATVQVNEAWRSVRQAFEYYARTGNVARAVHVAHFAGTQPLFLRPSQTQLVARALELVEEGSEEYGRLNVALGFSAGMLGDPERSDEAFRRADEVARRLGLRRLELDGLRNGMTAAFFQLRDDIGFAMVERAVPLARELGQASAEMLATFFGAARGLAGDPDAGQRYADDNRVMAERTRDSYVIAGSTFVQAFAASLRGDWELARGATARGLEVAPRDCRVLHYSALIALSVGDSVASDDFTAELVEVMKSTPAGPDLEHMHVAAWLPRASLMTGRPLDGPLFDAAARAVLGSAVPPTPWVAAVAHLGLAVRAAVDHDAVAAQDALAQIAALPTSIWGTMETTDHVRGLLLETLDRLDDAVDEMEHALDFLVPAYEAVRAEVAYDCARIRLQRGAASDRERARALIDESLALAQRLGMKPLVDRVVALKLQDQGIEHGGV